MSTEPRRPSAGLVVLEPAGAAATPFGAMAPAGVDPAHPIMTQGGLGWTGDCSLSWQHSVRGDFYFYNFEKL